MVWREDPERIIAFIEKMPHASKANVSFNTRERTLTYTDADGLVKVEKLFSWFHTLRGLTPREGPIGEPVLQCTQLHFFKLLPLMWDQLLERGAVGSNSSPSSFLCVRFPRRSDDAAFWTDIGNIISWMDAGTTSVQFLPVVSIHSRAEWTHFFESADLRWDGSSVWHSSLYVWSAAKEGW